MSPLRGFDLYLVFVGLCSWRSPYPSVVTVLNREVNVKGHILSMLLAKPAHRSCTKPGCSTNRSDLAAQPTPPQLSSVEEPDLALHGLMRAAFNLVTIDGAVLTIDHACLHHLPAQARLAFLEIVLKIHQLKRGRHAPAWVSNQMTDDRIKTL